MQQHQKDRYLALQRQCNQLKHEAEEQRCQLLNLAKEVHAWQKRTLRARNAGATELAEKADKHLNKLMEQGRNLWNDLEDLGRRFGEVDGQLQSLRKEEPSSSELEKDWAIFEAELDLELLKRKKGLED